MINSLNTKFSALKSGGTLRQQSHLKLGNAPVKSPETIASSNLRKLMAGMMAKVSAVNVRESRASTSPIPYI